MWICIQTNTGSFLKVSVVSRFSFLYSFPFYYYSPAFWNINEDGGGDDDDDDVCYDVCSTRMWAAGEQRPRVCADVGMSST